MYNRPFYYHPPSYQEGRSTNYPYPPQQQSYNPYPPQQQSYNPYSVQNDPMHVPTPFEHFSKPKQPVNWYQDMQQHTGEPNQQYNNPTNGFMTQFQDENGQINLDKMLSTVGQMANTYHQVSPIIKQFGDLVKTFR